MIVDRSRFPVAAVAAVGLVAALALSCGGGSSPSSSTPVTTLPAPPTPTPTPTPGGSGGDSFSHMSCPLGKGSANAACDKGRSVLLAEMESAMDTLIQQKPQIFDLQDEYAPGSRAYRVLDKEAYMVGLVAALRGAGLCSERDPDDLDLETIRTKNSSDFSEDFDVLLSSGHMRRGGGMYRQTCSPSSFPVERSSDAPPIGSGCGRPYPPPVTRFNCKVHLPIDGGYSLDSTAIVGPDVEYCASIGFTDGRSLCPVRPEGAPDRAACETWRVGHAKDTGRPGPTWTKADGSYCTGKAGGCENHPDNQYGLFTYTGGTYKVSAENGAYCTVTY
jgi:hypothetical protein